MFLEMMVAERGASENTVSAYRRDLGEFSLFCIAEGAGSKGLIRRILGSISISFAVKKNRPLVSLGAYQSYVSFMGFS